MGTVSQSMPVKRGPGRPPSQPKPEPANAKPPIEQLNEIEWVTAEEAARYDAMIYKPFIRRVEKEKGENKKYFWMIINACPYVPAGRLAPANKNLVAFNVQKYYRDQTITRNVFDENRKQPREVKSNAEVRWVSVDRTTGNPVVVNEDAVIHNIDSRVFEQQFVRDDS